MKLYLGLYLLLYFHFIIGSCSSGEGSWNVSVPGSKGSQEHDESLISNELLSAKRLEGFEKKCNEHLEEDTSVNQVPEALISSMLTFKLPRATRLRPLESIHLGELIC